MARANEPSGAATFAAGEHEMQKGLYMMTFGQNNLYRLDPATGSAGLIGAISVPGMTDIAIQGTAMWGITFSQFVRVNPQTAAATVIGNLGQGSMNGLAVSVGGTIYGSGGGDLYRIDPVTGAATAVGPFGGGLTSAGDIAFDSNDNLYAALNASFGTALAHVNANTGAATVIGNIGFPTYGLAFYCCKLYGAAYGGEVLQISVNTGVGTVIGKNAQPQGGLTSSECC